MRRALALSLLIVAAAFQLAVADVPEMISYQGVLTNADGSVVDDGVYVLTFQIYDVETDGSPLWGEAQPLTVTDGVFEAVLGSVTPIFLQFDVPYWLGISVGPDLELTPRTELTSSTLSARCGRRGSSCRRARATDTFLLPIRAAWLPGRSSLLATSRAYRLTTVSRAVGMPETSALLSAPETASRSALTRSPSWRQISRATVSPTMV